MNDRRKRSIYFGVALAIGFGIYDYFTLGVVNPTKIIGSAIIGGALYGLLLKIQGR